MMPTAAFPMQCEAVAPWKRALVTGGAGFLGSRLCARLLDSGVEVDCLDNLSTGRAGSVAHLAGRRGFRFLEQDILHLAGPACADSLTGPYDLVLHLAGPACPDAWPERPLELLDAGSTGTRAALAVADRDGARFLLASAPPAHGATGPLAPAEPGTDPADPVGPHRASAEATRFAEALVAAHAADHGSDAGVVRLFTAYGPGMRTDDGGVPGRFIASALAGEPVVVTGDGSRTHSLCYVDDMVDGILLVAAGRSVRPVDIGGEETPTEAEIARRVIDLTGSASPVTCDGTPADPARRPHPVTGFAREIFGWMPRVGWEEGLARTVASFREQAGPVPAAVVRGEGEWWA
ncbi:NAD-dependent epimerase/dehydratase family protein [Streptomyces sp. PRKS01-65]|nr:NAD-dependent epimerase/dehydratase family protein [Streptomyces harenosi]NEY36739.1 NAD-dependent epimerase/dehydratase family protein [Streptomyces harenosi]